MLAQHRSAPRNPAPRRGGVFADFRLRVAHVVRDYGMFERAEAPADSRAAYPAKATVGHG